MIELTLHVVCSCGSVSNAMLTGSNHGDVNEAELSDSIEQNSEGLFYCSQNHLDRMKINCVMCGSDIDLLY